MKIIGSVKEDLVGEKRISITPETVKKFVDLNMSVLLENKYGEHLGINDEEYKNKGASLNNSAKEVLEKSEIILRVNCPSNDEISIIKNKSILIGQFDPLSNKETINKLIKKEVKIFSLNLLPRITRAQSMDVLSSQANLAGYRAVIESVEEFGKAVPMMMTAAGTITPAKVLVIGAGVAGLQAIATAKRLGAIVSATDVRTVAKEQVESLGAKFLAVEGAENLETSGGYAKEAGEDFKKKQAELLKNSVKKNDIIICTALIPGKKAPRIISEEMVKSMKPGSIIYDLAVNQGGNSAFSEADKVNIVNGVKVMGAKNILNKLALTASNLYAKNLSSFVNNLYNKEKKDVYINQEDEIISKTLINKEL
jgi:NAD(P) transhydrogenase subunit alpha